MSRRFQWFMGCLTMLCALGSDPLGDRSPADPGAKQPRFAPVGSRDYHVSPGGDDSHSGTAAKPWKTIAKVNTTDLRPGDRVLFEGGKTFQGTISLDTRDSGVSDRKVRVSSYGSGRATINGGDGSGLIAKGCSHLVVEDLNFVGCGRKQGNNGSGVTVRDGTGIEVDRAEVSGFRLDGLAAISVRDTRITHVHAHDNGSSGIGVGGGDSAGELSENVYIGRCVAENNAGDPLNLDNHSGNGIVVGGVKGCLIEYCEAMNNGWDMPHEGNGPVGIWAWNADRVTIQFCVAHDNKSPSADGGGFDLDGGVTNSVLQYNYSYHNEGPGYFLCQYPTGPVWKNNIVRYNVSVNDGTKNNTQSALEVYGGDERMSDAEVYNNTVYNERGGAVGFGALPAPRVRFRNNIFVTGGQMIKGDPAPARFEGNCYWTIGGGRFAVGEHASLAEWAAATGQERTEGAILGRFADPLLTDLGSAPRLKPEQLESLAAYRLRPGSPCLGAGLLIQNNGGRDFWGRKVPKDKRPSIGAGEKP